MEDPIVNVNSLIAIYSIAIGNMITSYQLSHDKMYQLTRSSERSRTILNYTSLLNKSI